MSRPPWPLLLQAGVAMVGASAAIRTVPFRRIAAVIGSRRPGRAGTTQEVAIVTRAVRAWARRLPWRTLCFEQGLSAHWLLRRRGIESTLYYGAATIDGELKAHVWVRSGEIDVTGCDLAPDYAVLARFPTT